MSQATRPRWLAGIMFGGDRGYWLHSPATTMEEEEEATSLAASQGLHEDVMEVTARPAASTPADFARPLTTAAQHHRDGDQTGT